MSAAEGIYRRVSVRLWSDEKVRRLTPLQPSGQALWLYLMTGPQTGPIPGVFVAGRAALAEALDWDVEAFDACLAELVREGLVRFDRSTRLWFIPNALRHNPPASPNVVRSWRSAWTLLPEGDMRDQIGAALLASLEASSKPCAEAFAEVLGKPSAKASPNPCPNQEAGYRKQATGFSIQEQEERQATSLEVAPPRPVVEGPKLGVVAQPEAAQESELPGIPPAPLPKVPDCPHLAILELWAQVLPELPTHNPDMWGGTRAAHLRARWRETAAAKRWPDQAAGLLFFRKLFVFVSRSPFLTGKVPPREGKRPFILELEWLVNPTNWARVHEGKYHEPDAASQLPKTGPPGFDRDARDAEARALLGFAPLPAQPPRSGWRAKPGDLTGDQQIAASLAKAARIQAGMGSLMPAPTTENPDANA